MMRPYTTVADVLRALSRLTRGRLFQGEPGGAARARSPHVVWKSSGIPGKEVLEIPGLIVGKRDRPVRRVAMGITLTENVIELAGAMNVDLLICHHPVADGASAGGVPLSQYLGLYDLALIEVHEAFHGLHPGIPYLHGLDVVFRDTSFGGIPGNVVVVGEPLPDVRRLGDIPERLERFMGLGREQSILEAERAAVGTSAVESAAVATRPQILLGGPEDPVTGIIQVFPHSGTRPEHLEALVTRFPWCNTVVASISRVRPGAPLVDAAARLGLRFILGNPHALEVFENWVPLAHALAALLPRLEFLIWRERVSVVPLEFAGPPALREYAADMARHLLGEG